MAQFDVYPNPSKKTHGMIPFLVDVQNTVLAELATRLIIPLGNLQHFNNEEMKIIAPRLQFNGSDLILLTPQMASVPANILVKPAGNLVQFREQIIAAVDFAITGI